MRLSCYWSWISSKYCQSSCGSADYFDNVMTKFIVYNRTDALKTDINCFYDNKLSCQTVCAGSLTHHTNYKFMCLSAYWIKKLTQWARENFCSYSKKMDEKKKNRWAEITDNAVPVKTKRLQSSVFLKSCKISNMNIEILRIHEDYATTTIFTLMLLNGLLVLVSQNVKCQKKNWMFFFLKRFCMSGRNKDGTLYQFTKVH